MELYDNNFQTFATQYENEITALYEYGQILYAKGDFVNAVKYYVECVNKDWSENRKRRISVITKAGVACYALKDYHTAYTLFKLAVQLKPDKYFLLSNLGTAACRLGKYDEAATYFLKSHELKKDHLFSIDGLATVYSTLGDLENFHRYARMSLELKDKQAHDETNLTWLKTQLDVNEIIIDKNKITPKFNCETPERNIIAFSLWGKDPMYLKCASLNAIVAPIIYPGWRARFYCDDSVPAEIITQLKENQAEVVMTESKGAFYGLFWRFSVISDPEIDCFLIRDCDSVLNCQERVAVDEWLASDKHFHLMRDYYTQNELILAGLWGGVGRIIPNITSLIKAYYEKADKISSIDQLFLRHCVWPFVKQSHLAHDEYFEFGNAKPFPKLGKFPGDKWNVGQNWRAHLPKLE